MHSAIQLRNIGILGCLLLTAGNARSQENKLTRPIGNGIYEIAIDQSDRSLYVASIGKKGANAAYIYRLDPETLAATDSIHVEEPAFGVAINQATRTLYTSNTRSHSVYAIDLASRKVIAKISNGTDETHTREIVVDEKNNRVYVSDVSKESSIWVIDGNTHRYLHSIPSVGIYATGLAIDEEKQILYTTLMGEGKIAGIDIHTKQRTFEVAIDTNASPINMVLDKKKKRLYVSDSKLNQVHIIDIAGEKLLKSVNVDLYPIGIELDIKNDRIYTANREGRSVSVIDGNSLELIKSIPTGGLSNTIKTDPVTGATYVTNKQISLVNRQGEPTGKEPLENGDSVSLIK